MKYQAGKQASIAGIANEHIVLAILLPYFPDAMLSSHQQSTHDMIIPSGGNFIRAQIKTANKSVSSSPSACLFLNNALMNRTKQIMLKT